MVTIVGVAKSIVWEQLYSCVPSFVTTFRRHSNTTNDLIMTWHTGFAMYPDVPAQQD